MIGQNRSVFLFFSFSLSVFVDHFPSRTFRGYDAFCSVFAMHFTDDDYDCINIHLWKVWCVI